MLKLLHDVVNRYVKKRIFNTETDWLKGYFGTDEGIRNLLRFYAVSQIRPLQEPAAFLDGDTSEVDFFPVEQKRKDLYTAIMVRNNKGLGDLERQLVDQIEQDKKDGVDPTINTLFLEALQKYKNEGTNLRQVANQYERYCMANFHLPEEYKYRQGIVMHTHPLRAVTHTTADGRRYHGKTDVGYSPADIRNSKSVSLTLIEYQHNIRSIEGDPMLEIFFNIHHRFGQLEREVGKTEMHIAPRIQFVGDTQDQKVREAPMTFYLPESLAFYLIEQTPHLLPIIRIGEPKDRFTEQLAEHLAFLVETDITNLEPKSPGRIRMERDEIGAVLKLWNIDDIRAMLKKISSDSH